MVVESERGGPPTTESAGRFDWTWCLASVLVLTAHYFAVFPLTLGFDFYLVLDPGWGLGLDAAWCEGLTPAVDVEYYYGLLTVLIDRGWFFVFGRSPHAQAGLIAACVAAIHAGVLLLARSQVLSRAARWFVLLSIPVAVMPINFPSPAHALEAAFLSLALGCQAHRRLALALVLAVGAVYVKPSLGYLHGLLIVVQIVGTGGWELGVRERVRRMLPAAVVGMVGGGALAVAFGPTAMGRTLFPFATAGRVYAADRFGFFFGIGQKFVVPEHPTVGYYIFTPAGYWIGASVVLVLLIPFVRSWKHPADRSLAATAAVLHAAFVCFLFGNEFSWLYYPFYLVTGASVVLNAMSRSGSPLRVYLGRTVLVALACLAVSGQVLRSYIGYLTWTQLTYTPELGGLFISADEIPFWREMRQVGARRRIFVPSRSGGISQILPEIDSPRTWYLLRPIALPGEIEDVRRRMAEADYLVFPKAPPEVSVHRWPEFERELSAFEPVAESRTYAVLARKRKPPDPNSN